MCPNTIWSDMMREHYAATICCGAPLLYAGWYYSIFLPLSHFAFAPMARNKQHERSVHI